MTHRRSTRSRSVATATLLLLLSGLGACTDSDAEPEPRAGSSSPATLPSAVASSSSAAVESAEDFTRRIVSEFSSLLLTGETQGFADLSSPGCQKCNETIKDGKYFRRGIAQGITIHGAPIEVLSVEATKRGRVGAVETYRSVARTRVPERVYRSPEEGERRTAAEDKVMSFTIRLSDDEWTLMELAS